MKRLSYFVIAAVLTQSLGAHAQIMDLPDPGAGFDLTPDPVPATPAPAPEKPVEVKPAPVEQKPVEPKPETPAYAKYESSEKVYRISRKTGGLVYRLLLKPATSVRKITITATKARLLTHETYLITDSGQKVKVENFSMSQLIHTGSVAVSETIDYRGPISAFDIRAESMSGEADIIVSIYSDDAKTKIEWQKPNNAESQVPQTPQPPQSLPLETKENTPAERDFYVGERVVESYENIEIRTIKAIKPTDDGKKRLMLLDDGTWYHERHISKLLSEQNGFYLGERVVESFENREIRKIKAITVTAKQKKTLYLLDDGTWYAGAWISKLLSEKNGFYLGGRVVESFENREIRKIKAITVTAKEKKTLYLLDDGTWYAGAWISKLLSEKNGFYVGEQVVESFENKEVRKILAITVVKDGNKILFLLDDGTWYNISYLRKLR